MAFGHLSQNSNSAPMSDINVTPLVDVILVLLIVFMITAPLLTHAVKIDLPQAASQASTETPETATLSLNAEGQYFWNDQALDSAALDAKLKDWGQKPSTNELHLRADQNTRYQVIADVMSRARLAGVQKMGFVTEPPKSAQ